MPVKIQNNPRHWPVGVRQHLKDRLKDRRFKEEWSEVLKAWFSSNPEAPDLAESPSGRGWHKHFLEVPGLLITGEGQYWLTLYTPFEQGNPRPKSVDLDEWEASGRKPKISSLDIVAAVWGDDEEV